MSQAGVVSRGRQLYGDVAERLRSHGIEVVPFLTVGCLVAGFWCTLSLPTIAKAMGLRAEPARESAPVVRSSLRPQVQLRQTRAPSRPSKGSRERGETPVPAPLSVTVR